MNLQNFSTTMTAMTINRCEALILTLMTAHEQFVRQAIALAAEARGRGNHPFGALLVLGGEVVLTATNTVVTDRDPTAHAETNLVAAAIRHLPRDQIGRAVLYTSCEPCAMCAGKMYWAGIRLSFTVSRVKSWPSWPARTSSFPVASCSSGRSRPSWFLDRC